LCSSFSYSNYFSSQNELITGHNGFTKFYIIHAQEQRQFTGVFELLSEEQARNLSHSFNYENTRHNRCAGKMSLEELLIEGHIFNAGDFYI
jgi:hypothetical protein